jgi:hypothetical protein
MLVVPVKKLLLVGIAALSVLYASAVHAAGSPWTEADGKDVYFLALKNVRCGNVNYTVWQPIREKTEKPRKPKKALNFLRITSDENRPVTGISMDGEDVLLNGKRCIEEGIDYEPLPDQPSTLKQYLREKELKTKERERAVGD